MSTSDSNDLPTMAEIQELAPTTAEGARIKKRRLRVAALFFRDVPTAEIAKEVGASIPTVNRDILVWQLGRLKSERVDSSELRGVIADVLAEKTAKANYDRELQRMRIQFHPDGRAYTSVELRRPVPASVPFGVVVDLDSNLEVECSDGKHITRWYFTDAELARIKKDLLD